MTVDPDQLSDCQRRVIGEIKKRQGPNYRVALAFIVSDYPSHQVAAWFNLRPFQVSVYRKVLTEDQRTPIKSLRDLPLIRPITKADNDRETYSRVSVLAVCGDRRDLRLVNLDRNSPGDVWSVVR
jgi:hypothetical protein